MDSSVRNLLERYGPTMALIAAIVLLVALLPSNTHGTGTNASGSGSSSLAAGAAPGQQTGAAAGADAAAGAASGPGGATAAGGTSSTPGGAGAKANTPGATGPVAPGAVQGQTGTYPCRSDNRQAGISPYSPPCAQFNGNNGGATGAKGVSATAVKVAYYVPQANAATQAALKSAGAGDDQATYDRAIEVLRRYFNDHYQTYGREVQFTKEDASGASNDDVAAKADAHKLADKGYFAAFTAGGVTGSPTFDATLNSLGVICVGCTVSEADSFYQRTQGYNFGALPTAREYYEYMGEYWGKRLKDQNAVYAGPGPVGTPPSPSPTDLRNQKRKFGLIWLNANMGTVDPGAQEERDNFINNILPKWGITGVVDTSYNYDVSQGPTIAQTVISKMHSAGVTTVAMFSEPLMPVFFTREATKEGYFPEWFQTGVGLTDLTLFGRTYDSQQWEHSFGMSPLWVFWANNNVSDGYREYHHVCDQAGMDCTPGAEGVSINTDVTALLELFTGIQMAGPKLTAKSFADGEFAYPPTGGTPITPLWHMTPAAPTYFKDMTEIWWNVNGTGKDEVNNQGSGTVMKAQQGKRYQLGQWPAAGPFAFAQDPSPVYTSDTPYTTNGIQHEQNGHHHPPAEKCLSCGGPWPT